MAGGQRRKGKGSSRPNRQNKNKGPKAPEDERLWRRVTQHFSDPEDWGRAWSNAEVVEFLTVKERMEAQFSSDEKAGRAFQSKIEESLAFARKRQERIVSVEGKTMRFRRPAEIDTLVASVRKWKDFMSRHAGKGSVPLTGLPRLAEDGTGNDEDLILYALLEDVWQALLLNEPLPKAFALDGSGVRTWEGYDLVREAKRCAERRSGLRFRDNEPAMALLLLTSGRWTVRELLQNRLLARRRDGVNPFPDTYDAGLVDHADHLAEVDGDGEVAEGRTDLRHLPFVTIDPPDAKDFDDAVCLIEEGNKRTLWVAIADVAHYVRVNTALDRAARARATSVYLPHTVLPMLPPRLADHLCSLRADVDRLSMVISMELNTDNEIINTQAYEAVIHVKSNIAYGDVLQTNEYDTMLALAEYWQSKEIRLDLNNSELRPRLHGDETIAVEVKWPNDATRMIESFMVATNAAVGHLLGAKGAPLPWRCHAPPDRPEVEGLNAKLSAMDIPIELPMPSSRKHGESDAHELSNILGDWANLGSGEIDLSGIEDTTDDVPDYLSTVIDPEARDNILISLRQAQQAASSLTESTRRVVDQGLFQLMQRAVYSEENGGHFGLNLDAYVHFTSPIRRYPDLMAHRQLKSLIHGQEWVHSHEETAELAMHCSEQGLVAKRLEWELVSNTYHIHLMRGGSIGDSNEPAPTSYNARVVGLKAPWVFLDLGDDGAVSGRMHLAQLGGKQRLVVDEFGLEVTTAEPDHSGNTPVILQLGQRFACRLRGLDVWSGSLDLAPI
jgi:hypothetical protein